MNTTIFKTGSRLLNSTIGIGKVVINFNGGAETLLPQDYIGLHINRKEVETDVYETFKVRVFNGHLLTRISDQYIEVVAPLSVTMTETTDSDGNVIRDYSIASGIGEYQDQYFRWTVGTTRIEVESANVNFAGIQGTGTTHLTEPEMNIEQFAFLPFNTIWGFYDEKAYGDLKALKNRTDIKKVYVSGSKVTGDINNLAKSAYNLEGLSFYTSKVYGELSTLLDAMKAAGVRSRTLEGSFGETGVTYNGAALYGAALITFDARGNYTVTTS